MLTELRRIAMRVGALLATALYQCGGRLMVSALALFIVVCGREYFYKNKSLPEAIVDWSEFYLCFAIAIVAAHFIYKGQNEVVNGSTAAAKGRELTSDRTNKNGINT